MSIELICPNPRAPEERNVYSRVGIGADSKESAEPYPSSVCPPTRCVRQQRLEAETSGQSAASMCQRQSIQRGPPRVPSVPPDWQRGDPTPGAL